MLDGAWSRGWHRCLSYLHFEQLRSIHPLFGIVLGGILSLSFLLLYSAGKGLSPWCLRQLIHLVLGLGAMAFVASFHIRVLVGYANLFYGLALLCLLATTFLGVVGMGAQRWISLGFIKFQPSELMRLALILALAKQLFDTPLTEGWKAYLVPMGLILLPVLLTLEQPDLGTAMLLTLSGGAMFFFAGARLRFFGSILAAGAVLCPVLWHLLHDYQKHRIMTFLSPESDPLGRGYHALQSKIAIGSGGIWGKGFMNGSQGSLDFLPEKHTDFIFTLLSEELGFVGAAFLIVLYFSLILLNVLLAFSAKQTHQHLVISGLTVSLSCYMLINMGMVMGVLPVVGIPLPFVSYGGSSLLTLLVGQGLIFSAAYSSKRPNKARPVFSVEG